MTKKNSLWSVKVVFFSVNNDEPENIKKKFFIIRHNRDKGSRKESRNNSAYMRSGGKSAILTLSVMVM